MSETKSGDPDSACRAVVPIVISDKAQLVQDDLDKTIPEELLKNLKRRISNKAHLCQDDLNITIPENSKSGRTTWYLAVIALPLIGISFIALIFLLTGSSDKVPTAGRLQKAATRPAHHNYIFVVDINKNHLTQEKLNALTSCLSKNKHCDIFKLTINKYVDQPKSTAALELIKKKFPNFHYAFEDQKDFFKNSIFENDYNITQPTRVVLLKAQLLTLWRFGGVVISPTWIPTKSLEDQIQRFFSKNDNTLSAGTYNGEIAFLAAPNECNARVYNMMTEISNVNTSSPTFENDVFDRVFIESGSGVRRFGYPYLCNNNTFNDQCFFLKGDEDNSGKKMIKYSPTNQYMDTDYNPWTFKRFFLLS